MTNRKRSFQRYRNIVDAYENLDDFLDKLLTQRRNPIFTAYHSEIGSFEFTGTNSFEEAWNFCKYASYEADFDEFYDLFTDMNFQFEQDLDIVRRHKCVGYAPNVSRMLSGNPNNMRNKEKIRRPRKKINIYLNLSYSSYISQDIIRNTGICTLNLITYLENVKKYKVDFYLECISVEEYEKHSIEIKVKNENEKLDVKNLYFPIVHPSFLRRLIFRAREICEELQEEAWDIGYGEPYHNRLLEIKQLKNSIYIGNPEKMNILGNNLKDDHKKFIDYIFQEFSYIMDGTENHYE